MAERLSNAFGGVTIVQKGPNDIISNGKEGKGTAQRIHVSNHIIYHKWYTVLVCDSEGGLKRMGGQGDILSGVIATFLAWGKGYEDGVWK